MLLFVSPKRWSMWFSLMLQEPYVILACCESFGKRVVPYVGITHCKISQNLNRPVLRGCLRLRAGDAIFVLLLWNFLDLASGAIVNLILLVLGYNDERSFSIDGKFC